jgi:hypothetical protein
MVLPVMLTYMRYDAVWKAMKDDPALASLLSEPTEWIGKQNQTGELFPKEVVRVTVAIHEAGGDAYIMKPHQITYHAIELLNLNEVVLPDPPTLPVLEERSEKSGVRDLLVKQLGRYKAKRVKIIDRVKACDAEIASIGRALLLLDTPPPSQEKPKEPTANGVEDENVKRLGWIVVWQVLKLMRQRQSYADRLDDTTREKLGQFLLEQGYMVRAGRRSRFSTKFTDKELKRIALKFYTSADKI